MRHLCVGFLLLAALLAAAFVLATWYYRRLRLRAGAREIYNSMKRTWGNPLEILPASPNDFPHLDHAFYDDQQRQLQELGFRHLADLEVASLTRDNPNLLRTFIRVLSSTDGAIVAAVHQAIEAPRPYQPEPLSAAGATTGNEAGQQASKARSHQTVEFGTRFTDGSFLNTGRPNPSHHLASPPAIRRVVVEYPVTTAELLQRHVQEVEFYLESRPAIQPVPCLSAEQAIEMEQASHALVCEWRRRIGYLTRPELEKLAEGLEPSIVDAIWDELQRLASLDR